MASAGQKILRSTVLVMVLVVAAKSTGLLRDIIVASEFGTSGEMDAYLIATSIVSLMFVWFKNPVQVVLVPLFTEELAQQGEAVAWRNASVLVNTFILVLMFLAAIGWMLSPYLVSLLAPGFSRENSTLAAELTRITVLSLVFIGVAHLLSGFFQSYQRFGPPGAVSAIDNLVVIPAILLLTPLLGIYGLALGALLGAVSQVLTQAPILWKYRHHYSFRVDFKSATLRKMAWLSLPLLLSIGGGWIGSISDRIFASLLPSGSLAALEFGRRLTYVNFDLFIASLTTVMFPFFSKTAISQDYRDFSRKLFRSVRALFWIMLPVSVGMLLLHEPLVRLIYHRGAFGEESVAMTGQAVLFYAIGLSGFSLSNMLSYAFYSMKDTRTPVMMGLVRLAIKVALSFALVGWMAHAGLALAESLSFLVKAALLLLFLPVELKQPAYRRLFRSLGLTVVVAGAMGLVVWLAIPYFQQASEIGATFLSTLLHVAAVAGLGGGTYLLFSWLLQPAEMKDLYRFLRAGFARS